MKQQTRTFLSRYRGTVFVFPVLGVSLGILYFLALRREYEPSLGYFAWGAVLAPISYVLTALSLLCAAAFALASRRKISILRVPKGNALSASAAFLGVIAAACTALDFLLTPRTPENGKLAVLAGFTVLFLMPALLLSLFPSFAVSDARAFFWLLSAAAVMLSMFACYFDYALPLNSSVRSLTVLMQSAILLFLLAEARLALDPAARKTYVTAPFHLFACGSAASVGLGLSLGGLLEGFFGAGGLFGTDSAYGNPSLPLPRLALYFALALFALSRLFALPEIAGDYREPEPPEPPEKQER